MRSVPVQRFAALPFLWLLLCAGTRPVPAQTAKSIEVKPIEVKVLVLNYDPVVPGTWGQRVHEACKWNDPRDLSRQFAADIAEVSRGFIRYREVLWRDIDDIPLKNDGFRYSVAQYLQLHQANKGWHDPDGVDYRKLLRDQGVPALINDGTVDEVWIYGGPYFGYWESAMAGSGAFTINGGVYEDVPSRRAFAIMGFNYERGVNSMIHDLCHRTEATMARIFGGWQADQLTSDWARFAANVTQSKGEAGAGSCHYPPNALKDYDYANPREVQSTADDWLNYPNLTGRKTTVWCQTWGGPDYERSYLKWWFTRLPHADGVNPANGRLNNWWKYVYDFNSYTADGKPKG